MNRLKEKVAIVTEGTAGIGLTIATELCRERAADGDEVARRLGDAGHTTTCFLGNMGDEQFCQDLVRDAYDTYGCVDFLINNAFLFLTKGMDAMRHVQGHCPPTHTRRQLRPSAQRHPRQ